MGKELQICTSRQPESQKPLHRGSTAAQKFWQSGGFCGNIHQNSHCFVAKFPPSMWLLFWAKFHKYLGWFVAKFPKKIIPLCWKYSKISLFGNFLCLYISKKNSILENFHKNLLYWKISTQICFHKCPEHFHKTAIQPS